MYNDFYKLSQSENFNKIINSNGISESVIFLSDADNVVYKFYKNDPAYSRFVNWCVGRDDPHLPVIECVQETDDGFSKVKLEKLSPITEDEFYDLGLFDLINYALDQAEYVDHFILPTDEYLQEIVMRYPGFGRTIVSLYTALVDKHNKIDLHYENIMMRSGIPVIIDPLLP